MKRRTSKFNRGFTLVEMIVTLVIAAIVAAVAVPTMLDYVEYAEQNQRNKTAQSVYMAAQEAVSAHMDAGTIGEVSKNGEVNLESIRPALPEAELGNQKGVVYVTGENAVALLKDHLDPNVTGEAILVEYNCWTGRVLSAFYSEEVHELGYDGNYGFNVTERDPERLAQFKVGYYGTDNTGVYEKPLEIGDIDVRLVDYTEAGGTEGINSGNNYGLLTLECELPETLETAYNYELKLIDENGNEETVLISGDNGTVKLTNILTTNRELNYGLQNPAEDIEGRKLAFYTETKNGRQWLILVVDSIYNGLSIHDNFESIGPGKLAASFTVTGGGDSETVYTQTENAFFGGNTADGYVISSVRHLNNLRYVPTGTFTQTKDVLIGDIAGEPVFFEPVATFKGSYDGGMHQIQNLTVGETKNAGLFGVLAKDGTVTGVSIAYTDDYNKLFDDADDATKAKYYINGTENAGGIAGINSGTISLCSVSGRVISAGEGESVVAGGVAGVNTGIIEKCYVSADVSGKNAAGGVAGLLNANTEGKGGVIRWCEVGTALPKGTPYFGARAENIEYSYPDNTTADTTKNDLSSVSVTGGESDGTIAAGGVVGVINAGQVDYCVNAASVSAENGLAGGVAGIVNDGVGKTDAGLWRSYNAGTVSGKNVAGGVAASVTEKGALYSCYNTGNVNVTTKESDEPGVFVVDEHLNPTAVTGGIAGIMAGDASFCYNMQYAGNSPYSGAFGWVSNENDGSAGDGKSVECYFLLNELNTSSACIVDDEGTLAVKKGVSGISPASLYKQEIGAMDGHAGMFKYNYPGFKPEEENAADCALGEKFHRTPWQDIKPDSNLAKISLAAGTDETLFNVSFMFKEEAADIVLHTDKGDVIIPITAADKWTLISTGAVTIDGFTINSVPLARDSDEWKLGYTHTFTISTGWDKMPSGATEVTAYVYLAGEGGVSDSKWIAWSNTLEAPETEGTAKDINLTQNGNVINTQVFIPVGTKISNLSMFINYADGTSTEIHINTADINGIYVTDDMQNAIENAGKLSQAKSGDKTERYPFWKATNSSRDGYDEYNILLSWEGRSLAEAGLKAQSFYVTFNYAKVNLTSDSVPGRT